MEKNILKILLGEWKPVHKLCELHGQSQEFLMNCWWIMSKMEKIAVFI